MPTNFSQVNAFFRENGDAIANSTVLPSVEIYLVLINDNPHSRAFDRSVAECVARNSSKNGPVINPLRLLKEALLKMVDDTFSFKDLKDKMLNDAAFWALTLGRVLKFKEKPTRDTSTCMVLNEANEAHDEMLLLHLIVEVSLLAHPWPTFVCIYVEKIHLLQHIERLLFRQF